MAIIGFRLDEAGALTGTRNILDAWAFAAGGAAHAIADLGGVHVEFSQGAAEGVAMHAELFGSLALVALVLCQHFEDVALFELANGLRIRNAGVVHLRDQTVHFALQGFLAGGPFLEPLFHFASTCAT